MILTNRLPDFLEADFNNANRTTDSFQKFFKIVFFNLQFLKYVTCITYSISKSSDIKTIDTDKFLMNSFQIPSEGTWLQLLNTILGSNNVYLEDVKKNLRSKLRSQNIKNFLNTYYSIFNISGIGQECITVMEFFEKVINIKNRLVSHNLVTPELAEKVVNGLIPTTNDIINHLDNLLLVSLYLIEEDPESGKIEHMHIAGKHQNIDADTIQECFIENGLYFFTGNKLSFIKPLLICKDGIILFYNKFDSAHKRIICTAPLSRELYIKTSANNISELFYLDSESLSIKPLNIDIKISKNGTCHNLPSQDYREFIGRKKELELLNSAILHPRHFITALDGIGGVGKSAISLEFCNKILESKKDENIFFEFIIWVSAKTTKLENGKILKLTQSFEHLDQLLDTILDVLSFSEYKNFDYKIKTKVVCELLEQTKALIILDNLETVKKDNLKLIWEFINKIPDPSKVLLTSREYHYDVSQHVSINKLSDDDAREFIVKYCLNIGLDYTKIENYANQISSLSSGLPIAISSIIGQIYLGRSLNAIKNSIEKNQDDLAKFCFQDQLNLLNTDHKKVLLILCLSNEDLDFEAISYMIEPELIKPLQNAVKELKSLSLISINNINGTDIYYILPLIKNYILNTYIDEELRKYIESKLREFYQLKDIDSYNLYPYEEIALDKSSLIPRKLADKAIKHAEIGEFEQAEQYFKKVTKEYSQESYGWYIYSLYNAQYKSNYPEAINCLKKANDIKPNYLYNKKIGDYNLKLKNYDAAISNYKTAHSIATIPKNKNEMLYSIGNAQFEKVKYIRRLINRNGLDKQNERNESYKQIILNFENYLDATEEIYDGKKIKIYRCLSEAYLGLKDKDSALDYINKAIELSEGDQTHINFRNIINK